MTYVILYICSIDVTLMSLINIFNFVDLFDCCQLFFFSLFSSCYYGTLKRVYETSNLSNTTFFKHFIFENNLTFENMVDFPCFRKFEVNPKDFTLKRHLISSAFNYYKKVLMKTFSQYCSQDPYGPPSFFEKCWHEQLFRAAL